MDRSRSSRLEIVSNVLMYEDRIGSAAVSCFDCETMFLFCSDLLKFTAIVSTFGASDILKL